MALKTNHLMLLSSLVLLNCATTVRMMPLSPHVADVPVPLQQEHVATVAREAVASAVGELDYADLAGKRGRVQVSGVYQPNFEALTFIGAAAESELARRGVHVDPRAVPHATLISGLPTTTPPALLESLVPQNPDFVLSLTVDSAGVDYSAVPVLRGPIALLGSAGAMLVGGGVLFGVGVAEFDSSFRTVGAVMAGAGLTAAIAGLVWFFLPPKKVTATSRVKLLATVQPTAGALKPQHRAGSAEKAIEVDRTLTQTLP